MPAKMSCYHSNFDEMSDSEKAETIVMALETLPSIAVLRTYLIEQSRSSEPNLKAWKERVSPAALGVLRWIVASNRSCIIQVDKCPGQSDADVLAAKIRLNQRVSNISESWVQFRFAQGSPDKEQKFLNALKDQQGNFDSKYPTMFAFHGSPLHNWHSIIRHGLDFKEIAHGRAYGNGVYHSQDQSVSIGYAMHNTSAWHGSALKISSAMSLNEIVNCASQFTSSTPHLVVQHIDWIQCRYLMVQVQGTAEYGTRGNSDTVSQPLTAPAEVVEQDPKFVAKSTLHKPIGVPLCAVAVSRAFRISANTAAISILSNQPSGKKKRKIISTKDPLGLVDMAASDSEDVADINFLFSENEDDNLSKKKQTK
jgi:ubiquitin-conjugating enzyme E2 Q